MGQACVTERKRKSCFFVGVIIFISGLGQMRHFFKLTNQFPSFLGFLMGPHTNQSISQIFWGTVSLVQSNPFPGVDKQVSIVAILASTWHTRSRRFSLLFIFLPQDANRGVWQRMSWKVYESVTSW